MPKIPSKKQKRVTCRYILRRLDQDEYWAKAFDQGNQRYREADVYGMDREEVTRTAREKVNKSWKDAP